MDTYGVRDVERLLRVSRATLRSLVESGFVTPTRGARNSWQFSFRDLIVLRTAQALVEANVPARRITRSLRELRRHLPESMPLSGLAIGAVADRVVVREGATRWQAESGQYLLGFETDPVNGAPRVLPRPAAPRPEATVGDAFASALALEARDAAAAMAAYREVIVADPTQVDARINLGLLLHEADRHAEALQVYADALDACGPDPTLLFNLGVLLEDLARPGDAVQAYRAALHGDPELADGHYNLALLYRRLGKPREAIRHLSVYRRLTHSRR